ncbi:MAG: Octanoyltransferase LipM [Verrucomicrobiae bacterium]|nr:Octanoyltransferase LipM [Verrucomicrobiae bacterium]
MEMWDLLQSPAASPAINMATDEVLLRTAAQRGRPLLRLYTWDKPAVSIGYFQKFPAELTGKFDIVRRLTGGGLVYHVNDTTFTVVVPPGHALHKLKTNDAYCAIHQAVAITLHSQLTTHNATPRGNYECFQNPVAGDVVAATGEKLAGGAQRRNRDGMLHQGSIAAKVADLPAGFRQQFDCDFQPYNLTGEEHAMITWLADGKYSAVAWNKRL